MFPNFVKKVSLMNYRPVAFLNLLGLAALGIGIFVLEQGSEMQAHFFAAAFILLINWVIILIAAFFFGMFVINPLLRKLGK